MIRILNSRGELLIQIEFHNSNQLTTMTDMSIVLWPGIFATKKKIKVNTEKTIHCQIITRLHRKFRSSEGLEEIYRSGKRQKVASLRFKYVSIKSRFLCWILRQSAFHSIMHAINCSKLSIPLHLVISLRHQYSYEEVAF